MKTTPRFGFRGTLAALLLASTIPATQAVEIDLLPPDYRGRPGSIVASWEFFLDPTPGVPIEVLPDRFEVVPTSGGHPLSPINFGIPALALAGVPPVLLPTFTPVPGTDLGVVTFAMPNFITDHAQDRYRIQTALLVGAGVPVSVLGLDGITDEVGLVIGVPASAPLLIPLPGTAGLYLAQDWVVSPSPDLAFVNVLLPAATASLTLSVIIDSFTVPAPPALLLVGTGLAALLMMARRRRPRAR